MKLSSSLLALLLAGNQSKSVSTNQEIGDTLPFQTPSLLEINMSVSLPNMARFIGTKSIRAIPMDRLTYNVYRGWTVPVNEDGADQGFLVEYTDGGKPNDPRHEGYISWSPKEQFENAYRTNGRMTFGDAIYSMKKGMRVSRQGWNGKDMWIAMSGPMEGSTIEASKFWSPHNEAFAISNGGSATVLPTITMKTADGKILMGWLASQSDMFAEDWTVV
jgi:hypothetical protein